MDILQYFNEAEAQRRAREEALRQALAPPKEKLAQEILRDMQRQEALQEKQMYHTGTLQERQMYHTGTLQTRQEILAERQRHNQEIEALRKNLLDWRKLAGTNKNIIASGRFKTQAYNVARQATGDIARVAATFQQLGDADALALLNNIQSTSREFIKPDGSYDINRYSEWLKKFKANVQTNPNGYVAVPLQDDNSPFRRRISHYYQANDVNGNTLYFRNKPDDKDVKKYGISTIKEISIVKPESKNFIENVLDYLKIKMEATNWAHGKSTGARFYSKTATTPKAPLQGLPKDRRVLIKQIRSQIDAIYSDPNFDPNVNPQKAYKLIEQLNYPPTYEGLQQFLKDARQMNE